MNLPALSSFRRAFSTVSLIALTAWMTTGAEQSQARSNRSSTDLADGIYLYGQVAQPNQISKGYVVFQNIDGQVVGAFYYPKSDFECFRGNLDSKTLDVQPISADSRDIESGITELRNFHQLSASNNDRRILSVCQQEVKAALNLPR
jgi:hypothetical protein